MNLLLSADALLGAAPDALALACRRRAFAGFEGTTTDIGTAEALAAQRLAMPWLLHPGSAIPAALPDQARRVGAGLLLASLPYGPLPTGRIAFVHDSDPDAAVHSSLGARPCVVAPLSGPVSDPNR